MSAARVLLALFPPPRRPLTWASAAPLGVFLALFGAALLHVKLRRLVEFATPGAFWLLLVAPWVWWLHLAGGGSDTRRRALLVLGVRLGVVGLLVGLLAGPQAVRSSDRLTVVYVLDLSDSIGEPAVDRALRYVLETVAGKPDADRAGLVVFGRQAAVELPPRTTFPFEAVNVRVARDGTNLEKGLALAAAVAPEDQAARLVLITDGSATEGNLTAALDELRARRIPVDVLPIQYDFDDEVWVERLDLPYRVKEGETYEASVVVNALAAGAGKLVLRENGRVIFEDRVEYRAGKNRYVMPIRLREPGYYEYVCTLEAPAGKDGWAANNRAVGAVYLAGKGKILVVTDPEGEARDWQPLVRALRRASRLVEVKAALELPASAPSLLPYHAVVFANVPADAFAAPQLRALRDAVFHFGTGFLMVGGQGSFGPGGYRRTPVEEALPVTMDVSQKKVLPKGALAIVLHTCEFAQGNTWAKRITKAAMRVLAAEDEVGVLAYDAQGRDRWLFPLTPAREYERLVPLVNRAVIADMPGFGPTMRMGLAALRASDAAARHMIVISDGDPSPPSRKLVQGLIAAGVSVSTVIIQPHGGSDVNLMRGLARATGGRFYHPQSPTALPRIFIKEAKTLRRNMIQNRTFTPEPAFPSPVLKGLETLPPLHGYVLTTAKARAELVLKVPGREEIDPVLAVWRFGVGKTAAFTSDLGTNWGRSWVAWERYRAFVSQLLRAISRGERATRLFVRSFAHGATGVIVVEDHGRGSLTLEAAVREPGGEVRQVPLEQAGPRRYRGAFPLAGRGRYQIVVAGRGSGRAEQAMGALVVPYSAEYLRFRADPITLRRIARRTGGRVLTGAEKASDIFLAARQVKRTARPIFDWLLVLLACLIPLDVACRRLHLRGSTEPGSVVPRPGGGGPGAAPAPGARPAGAPETEALTTTARLLEAKRRRQRGPR